MFVIDHDAGIAEVSFIDIGGGFPMRYLQHDDQWENFWTSLEGALRVEHRKRMGDDWLIGLAMNSSNCRSQKSELFTDPRLVRIAGTPAADDMPMAGYLAGAYCSEGDLVMHRRLRFDGGVNIGDVVAIPNTAGYLMHFTESRSHQFPLPLNIDLTDGIPKLDWIDRGSQDAS